MTTAANGSWKRLLPAAQSTLVRSYKLVGLAALAAILIGLLSFLTVNGFYLFDNTWLRPVILSPSQEQVRDVNKDLQAEITQRDNLKLEKAQLEAELAALDRRIETNQSFEADYSEIAKADRDLASLLARRQVDEARLERLEAVDRRAVLKDKLATLEGGIARYDRLISQFKDSPYIAAREREVVVAFVPYENLDQIHPGISIYGCKLRLVWCAEVGEVVNILEGEVTNNHPQSGSSERGLLLEIRLSEAWAAKERALFAGSKPFWIF